MMPRSTLSDLLDKAEVQENERAPLEAALASQRKERTLLSALV
jgi:hypothetical protein